MIDPVDTGFASVSWTPDEPRRTAEHSASTLWLRALLVTAATLAGLVAVGWGDALARVRAPLAEPLFWTGVVLIVAPAVAVLLRPTVSRNEALGVVLVVGIALYLVKVLHSPAFFTMYDEILHYRTLDDIVRTGRLFNENPLLQVSPFYPGLELVTHALMGVTGLRIFPAALVVVGAARVLMIAALFLFLERVALPPRLAGLAAIVYMGGPSFLYFDGQYAYESLALPLAVFCLFALRQAQLEDRERRILFNVLAFAAGLGVVVTHHVTSYLLSGVLLLWTLAALISRRRAVEPIPGDGWVPLVLAAASVFWLTQIAAPTMTYLFPHATSAISEVLRLIAGEEAGRRLFQSNAGHVAPLLERVVGFGSVGLILLGLPFGALYVWRHQRHDVLARFLVVCTLGYPAIMAMRFTRSGWDAASRATAFVYVPLAFALAAGVEYLRAAHPRRMTWWVVTPLVVVVFAGGIIAGNAPKDRIPGPYSPGAGEASIEAQGVAGAEWAAEVFGSGNRMVADSTNSSLWGSIGRQRVVTAEDDISVSELFLAPRFDVYDREILAGGDIRYMLVDRRIEGVAPVRGYFYEKWEHEVHDYGSKVPTSTLFRFDTMPETSRVFDDGSLQLYDVSRLAR